MLSCVPTLRVRTPEGIELSHEVAGAGSRFAAGLLDLLVLGGLYLFVTVAVLVTLLVGGGLEAIGSFVGGLLGGGVILTGVLYTLLFHLRWAGQTPGKRQLGLRVASADGYPASTFQLLLRGLVLPVDVLLFVPVPLGLLLIAVTPRCQRLGDLAARTVVLRDRAVDSSAEPWPDEAWSTRAERGLDLLPGMAAHLTDEDLRLLRDVIVRRGLSEEHAEALYARVVRHYSERLGFETSLGARRTLKELYLFARESRRATP
jgi:uncharacterized RDD family membrane protein YckC